MSDLIDRQAVLDYVFRPYSNEELYSNIDIAKFIEQLPSAENKGEWIPVSERLPETNDDVLVCFDFKGNRSVYISHYYDDGNFCGLDDEYLTPEGRKYRKVVAWMPLPNPWKGE